MALVSMKAIREMLQKCAPTYSMELKTHNWFVYFNGLKYPSLPKYDEIEAFHVRKMARVFGIAGCAKEFFDF